MAIGLLELLVEVLDVVFEHKQVRRPVARQADETGVVRTRCTPSTSWLSLKRTRTGAFARSESLEIFHLLERLFGRFFWLPFAGHEDLCSRRG